MIHQVPAMTDTRGCITSSKKLCIDDVISVSSALKDLVGLSFGPIARPSLLTTNTGQVVFTKDAHSLLSALSLPHPIAKYIMKTVDVHADVYGDGCKTLVLYLNELLLEIEKNFHAFAHGFGDKAARSGVSLSLTKFVNEELVVICSRLHKYLIDSQINSDMKDINPINGLRYVLGTTLSESLPFDGHQHIVGLLSDFFAYYESIKHTSRSELNQQFKNCVHIFPNKLYVNSHLDTGFYFHGILSNMQTELSDVLFVLTLCPLDQHSIDDDKDEYFLEFKPELHSDAVIYQRINTVKSFLSALQKLGISLIITCHKVPDYALQQCRDCNISVISCLDSEDIEFLSNHTAKSPVMSVHEPLTDANICMAELCKQVYHGGKPMLQILCRPSEAGHGVGKSLFLYAPSDGQCQQLKNAIKKCFKVVSALFNGETVCTVGLSGTTNVKDKGDCSSLESVNVAAKMSTSTVNNGHQSLTSSNSNVLTSLQPNMIPAGGYFEYLLSHFIEQYSLSVDSREMKLWAKVVAKMLMVVPRTLYHNQSRCQTNMASGFLTVSHAIKQRIQENKIAGIGSKGCVSDMGGIGEVLTIKLATCFSALDLAAKLLRIDAVVGVKRIASDYPCDEDYEPT